MKTSFSQYVMEGFQVEEWSIKFKFQLKQHNFIRSQEMEHLLNCIKEPTVCHKCFEEFKKDPSISPSLRDYTLLDVGFTDIGSKSIVEDMYEMCVMWISMGTN